MVENQDEKIQRYLDDEMSLDERMLFEEQLRKDDALAEDLDYQKDVTNFFNTRDPKLKAELKALGKEFIAEEQPKRRFPIWAAVALALLLVVLIYFMFVNKTTVIEEDNTPTNTEQQQEEELEEEEQVEEQQSPTTPIQEERDEPSNDNSEMPNIPEGQPIAAVDPALYQRNPLVEDMIRGNVRASDEDEIITVTQPVIDTVFAFQEKIPFTFSGRTSISPKYNLALYSNKADDIENDIRILDVELDGTANGEEYTFEFNSEISLKKGLYYLFIREVDSFEVLYVSRFTVE